MRKIPEIDEFIQLFNQQKFFEAHEVLELVWRKEKQKGSSADLKFQNFCQGLIQIAASLVHVQKNNPEGARRVFHSALNYLQQSSSETYGIALEQLIQDTEKCLDHSKSFPQID